MTIGSQLRDIYIKALERESGPVVEVTEEMLKNENVMLLVQEAHASPEATHTLAAFTVSIKDGHTYLYAPHVYARALMGESIGSKKRPNAAHRKFLKKNEAGHKALLAKKFSANPLMNVNITFEHIMEKEVKEE